MKSWYASKTLWFNIVGGVVAILLAFGIDLGLGEEEKAAIVGGIMAIVNIVLRFVTTESIGSS